MKVAFERVLQPLSGARFLRGGVTSFAHLNLTEREEYKRRSCGAAINAICFAQTIRERGHVPGIEFLRGPLSGNESLNMVLLAKFAHSQ